MSIGCDCWFAPGCAQLGVRYCVGCGGDLCICTCGGEIECEGCEDCDLDDRDFPPEPAGEGPGP